MLLNALVAIVATLWLAGGCHSWTAPAGSELKLLRPPAASPESVTLEIFRVRLAPDDQQHVEQLWRDADEQFLPTDVRIALARNGIKAGLLPVGLSPPLERLLRLRPEDPPRQGESEQLQKVDVTREPMVRRRLVQFRAGDRAEIVASETYDELPLLHSRRDGLAGETLVRAQCILDVTAETAPDGQATLRLTPTVQHGEPKQQFRGEDGVLRADFSRPALVLRDMVVSADLSSGQMLLVGPEPGRPGSLGSYFFSGGAAIGAEKKLLLIRLLRGPAEEPYGSLDGP